MTEMTKIVRLDNIALPGNWGQKLYFDDDMTIRISKLGVNAHGKGRIETEGVGDRSRKLREEGVVYEYRRIKKIFLRKILTVL